MPNVDLLYAAVLRTEGSDDVEGVMALAMDVSAFLLLASTLADAVDTSQPQSDEAKLTRKLWRIAIQAGVVSPEMEADAEREIARRASDPARRRRARRT